MKINKNGQKSINYRHRGSDGSLVAVSRVNADLVEGFKQVHLAEHLRASYLVHKISQIWERVSIQLCLLIKCSEVPCRTKRSVLFRYKMYWTSPSVGLGGIYPLNDAKIKQLEPWPWSPSRCLEGVFGP